MSSIKAAIKRFPTLRKKSKQPSQAPTQSSTLPTLDESQTYYTTPNPNQSYTYAPFAPTDIHKPQEIDGRAVRNGPYPPFQRKPIEQHADTQPLRPGPRSVKTQPDPPAQYQVHSPPPHLSPVEQPRETTPNAESIRHLRGQVREKYRLDLWVWNKRHVMEDEREVVRQEYLKADRIFKEICEVVDGWGNKAAFANDEEWQVAQMIRSSIGKCNQDLTWESKPPWEREKGARSVDFDF